MINPSPIAAVDTPKIIKKVYPLFYVLTLNSLAYNVENNLN